MYFKEKEKTEENRTGIPLQLKRRMEEHTGLSFQDVRVHYNSGQPGEINALACTQGTQVYLAPGEEKHLPHELGHVVQQKQGIVKADTRHPGGVWLNTDPKLEQEADQIGAKGNLPIHTEKTERFSGPAPGESAETSLERAPGESFLPVQRMSVFEGMKTKYVKKQLKREMGEAPDNADKTHRVPVQVPQVARYKREGWFAVSDLKQYFTEESIKLSNIGDLLDAYFQLGEFDFAGNAPDRDISELADLNGQLEWAQGVYEQIASGAVSLKAVIDSLERCVNFVTNIKPETFEEPLSGIEKKGDYRRVGEMDPYFNPKKIAIHCVAHMATKIRLDHEAHDSDAGPHIAITVLGNRIYIANNTWFKPFGQDQPAPVDMKTLREKVRYVLDHITEERVVEIMKNQGEKFVSGAGFEGSKTPAGIDLAGSEMLPEVMKQIEKIKAYEIVVLDVPQNRQYESGLARGHSPIHGEMTIMDYLEHEANEPAERGAEGLPETTNRILERRNAKVREVDPSGTMKRVIQFGGTRIDCKKCHEHFRALRESIAGNFVVSSLHTGDSYFRGTENGTTPASKGMERQATVAASELTVHFESVTDTLRQIKDRVEHATDRTQLALSPEESALLGSLPGYRQDLAAAKGKVKESERPKFDQLDALIQSVLGLYHALPQD